MTKGDRKLFKNKEKLYAVINLRRCGYSLSSLSLMFECDRKTIYSQCKKYGIGDPEEAYCLANIISFFLPRNASPILSVRPKYKIEVIRGERINVGKGSYKEYLAEEAQRTHIPIERLLETASI